MISNLGDKQGSKVAGKVLLALSLLLGVLLAGTYLLRNFLVATVLNHFGQEQHLRVNCLDMDFDWQLNVQVNTLCIELPNTKLHLEHAQWLRSQNDLTISRVQVQHRDSPTIGSDKAETPSSADFQLPQNLPTIKIETLTITSPMLSRELHLGLELDRTATLTISGDITASLQQVEQKWQAEVEWSLAELLQTLPAGQALQQQYADWLSDEVAASASFVSHIDFDGKLLNASHDLNFDSELAFPHCRLQLNMVGSFNTRVAQPFMATSIEIDLSALHNIFDLGACEALPESVSDWQLSQFSLHIPKPIYLDFQQLTISEIQLSGLNDAAQQQLVLNNINYEFSGAIAAVYRLHVEQALQTFNLNFGQVKLNSTGSVSAVLPDDKAMTGLSWLLEDGQLHLNLQQISNDKLSLQQLSADFELKGSDVNGLQLSGGLDANTFTGFDLTLAKVSSNVDLSIDSNQQMQIKLKNQLHQLSYQQFTLVLIDNQVVASAKLPGSPVDFGLKNLNQVSLSADSVMAKLQSPTVTVAKLSNQLEVVGNDLDKLQFKLTSQLDNNQFDGIKLNKLNNQLNGNLLTLTDIDFSGQTNISSIVIDKAGQPLKFKAMTIDHQGRSALSMDTTFSEHSMVLENDFRLNLAQQKQLLSLQIEQQNITSLQPLISQLSPDLTVTQGKLNATANASLDPLKVVANVVLNDGSGRYTDYLFSGVNIQSPLSLGSAGLQLDGSTLQVSLLNVGLPVEAIKAQLLSVDGALKLENIAGNTLGGQFSVKDIWLDQREQHFDVILENIDLAQIVALQDQPGISITGQVGGKLPISSSLQTVSIEDGIVQTQGGGILTINGNPAFDSIKKQQSELAFLENYHFSQLGSKVTLKPDGWLLLDLAFVGQNPDKKQAVNFNYSHQENLFTLLETLRITNSIQDKIEQSISKGGQQ